MHIWEWYSPNRCHRHIYIYVLITTGQRILDKMTEIKSSSNGFFLQHLEGWKRNSFFSTFHFYSRFSDMLYSFQTLILVIIGIRLKAKYSLVWDLQIVNASSQVDLWKLASYFMDQGKKRSMQQTSPTTTTLCYLPCKEIYKHSLSECTLKRWYLSSECWQMVFSSPCKVFVPKPRIFNIAGDICRNYFIIKCCE